MPRPKFPSLKKTPEDELIYFQSLLSESDRGCVILVACRLDDLLYHLHEAHIHATAPDASDKWVEDLLDVERPVGSFSARIKIAYAYGLISRAVFQGLETIRKLRNDAAHLTHHEVFSFDVPTLMKQVLTLNLLPEMTEEDRQKVVAVTKDAPTTKLFLVGAGMGISIEIMRKITSIFEASKAHADSLLTALRNASS